MKQRSWLAGALVLALSLTALGADADGQAGTVTPQTPAVKAVAIPDVAVATSESAYREAMQTLQRERQDFSQTFDWNQGERQARKSAYVAAMDRFARRELELKRDWYQASGQTGLLERTLAALERRVNPPRGLPEIAAGRPAAIHAQSPEGSR